MRRRILLGIPTSLTVYLAMMLTPLHAQAAAPTCTTKLNVITSWSIQSDSVSGAVNTQCGGAQPGNQGDYYVRYRLDYHAANSWFVFQCDSGGNCESAKPTSGLFSGGDPHSFNWTFNIAGQIDCHQIRTHTTIVFPNYLPNPGYSITWNGTTNQVGC